MKTLVLALVAGTCLNGLSLATFARAEPVVLTRSMVDNAYVKRPRYCDQHGRCWTEGYRNPLLASYALAPPPVQYGSNRPTTSKMATVARASTLAASKRSEAVLRNAMGSTTQPRLRQK